MSCCAIIVTFHPGAEITVNDEYYFASLKFRVSNGK
jgi:hypothetical protein